MPTLAEFLSMPMAAGAQDRARGGFMRDEAGNPVNQTVLGDIYRMRPQAEAEAARRKAVNDALLAAAQSGQPFDPALQQAKQDIGTPQQFMGDILAGAVEGVTAPGRAARGETMTMGDVASTALDYGVMAAPMPKPKGALGAGSIRAYHGSPHSFDRFSMDKIGTGEGAQAYGHGLYFAESEDVARSYRDSLAQKVAVDGKPILSNNRRVGSKGDDYLDDVLVAHNGDLDAAIADETVFAREMEGRTPRRGGGQDPWETVRKLEALRGKIDSQNTGSMYEVRINADPDDFLDWDRPINDQPPRVAERIRGTALDRRLPSIADAKEQAAAVLRSMKGAEGAGSWVDDSIEAEVEAMMGSNDWNQLARNLKTTAQGFGLDTEVGQRLFPGAQARIDNFLREFADNSIAADPSQIALGPEKATALREAGIPGIKYRDAGSRTLLGGDGGTRNYVVFDENLIEIVRKYGIAGAAALTGMSVAELEAQTGQGPMREYLQQ